MSDQLQEVLDTIPHRPPFLFVDRIVEKDDKKIQTEKQITGKEDFFRGHYPDRPIMPGVLLCECVFQAGALFLAQSLDLGEEANNSSPAVTRINNVKFKLPVRPGDKLDIHAQLTDRMGKVFYMKGHISREGKKVMSLDFACTLIEDNT
ncbi:MAG: 3-hydroxyacyl-ACP dehydratase FabZ [Planctomycetes bacterium]|nr:3-hydroxyacyl-ACP dehydratase FabZ [Planctomycetota bacterium]